MITSILDQTNHDGILIGFGEQRYSQVDLRDKSLTLNDILAKQRGQTCFVQSDNPAEILVALDACIRSQSHLMIVHTSLSHDITDGLIEKFLPAVIVNDDSVRELDGAISTVSEPNFFLMTSGTTGQPKIAAHRLDRLVGFIKRPSQIAPRNWMLTYQATGFAGLQVILSALLSRGRLFAPHVRTPPAFLATARQNAVTHVSGTPTFWRSLLIAGTQDLKFEQITLGGEAVNQLILDRLRNAFPRARLSHTYASTEAGMVFAVHDGKEGFPYDWLSNPPNGIELRIVDGFLHIRSARIMRQYANLDQQPIQDDDWLVTRDRCEVKGDRVRIIGREDSVINVAGSKVYPAELETFLLQQKGVMEARVIGIQNPISGALVSAEIVGQPGLCPVELKLHLINVCRQELPSFKVPRILKIVDQLDIGYSMKKG